MSSDVLEMIRSADASRLVDAKHGPSNVLIRCPFHKGGEERTPSLSVKIDAPVFFCHGCQENGHITKLLTALGMPRDLAKRLVDAANFPEAGRAAQRRGDYRFYHGPNPFRGEYILDEDILDEFRLMPTQLREAGFKKSTLRHFGVGFDYDRYRITYPLRNIYGELVGISGRTIIDEEPRYKIYGKELSEIADVPESYSMDSVKKAILWHGHSVIPVLYRRADEPIVVCEGFKAAMWVWQAGIRNVVALVGSYLTYEHAELLAAIGCPVFLFLDNNEAGLKGTLSALRRLKNPERYVCRYPDLREQPDDLDPEEVHEALGSAQNHIEWVGENRNVVRSKPRHPRR